MIEAVIFDMDGLILDSEPYWKDAEIKIFNSIGVPLTSDMCDTTVGMRIEEVVSHWHEKYPWDSELNGNSFEDITTAVIQNVITLINKKAKPFEGVNYIIKFFRDRNIKTAIASSSAISIINAVLDKFGIRDKFEVIHSAEFEQYGKPNPAVYITTAKLLDVHPFRCLTFEDSYNGMLAAKDAGMKTVVIPEERYFNDARFDIADMKLALLKEFKTEQFETINRP